MCLQMTVIDNTLFQKKNFIEMKVLVNSRLLRSYPLSLLLWEWSRLNTKAFIDQKRINEAEVILMIPPRYIIQRLMLTITKS